MEQNVDNVIGYQIQLCSEKTASLLCCSWLSSVMKRCGEKYSFWVAVDQKEEPSSAIQRVSGLTPSVPGPHVKVSLGFVEPHVASRVSISV